MILEVFFNLNSSVTISRRPRIWVLSPYVSKEQHWKVPSCPIWWPLLSPSVPQTLCKSQALSGRRMKDISFLPSAFTVSYKRKPSVSTTEVQLPCPCADSKIGTQQTLLLQHKFPHCHQVQPQTSPGRKAEWLRSAVTQGRIISAPQRYFNSLLVFKAVDYCLPCFSVTSTALEGAGLLHWCSCPRRLKGTPTSLLSPYPENKKALICKGKLYSP